MLWYKAWLDTRWRFVVGLMVLVVLGCGTAFDWAAASAISARATDAMDTSTALGRRLKEAIELTRDYRGHVWLQWFRQNLSQVGTLVAALLGRGGIAAGTPNGSALFTLSLPISRAQLIGARAAVGFLQLFAIVLAASLVIPLMAPAVGQHYGLAETIVHCVCAFAAVAVFFSLALLLSTMFDDLWRPFLLTCALAVFLAVGELVLRDLSTYGVFRLMSGESYFRTGRVPWAGIAIVAVISAGLIGAAAVNLDRRDF